MSTIYKFRRAAESPWVRREERDWVQPRRSMSEDETGLSRVTRHSFGPLGELLTCDVESLPEVGARVTRWFDDQGTAQDSMLGLLAYRASSGLLAGRAIGDHNRIAAIEILARYSHWSASRLINRYLSQPIREYHLFAMPLARLQQLARSSDVGAIAGNIVRLYRESNGFQPAQRWRERFTVEVFRTLVEISPAEVVGALATELVSVGDLELTPILESVSLAARKFDQATLSQGPLGASLARIWACYVENRSTGDIGNRPGIMGRLAELLGRTGADLDSLFSALNDHPLRMQVLYQFTRRPLDFAPVESRFRWYVDVLKSMTNAKQTLAFKRFLIEVVVPDLTPKLQNALVRMFARDRE